MNKFIGMVLCLSLVVGCSAQQIAALKADEAVVKSDIHTGATIVVGVLTQVNNIANTNPNLVTLAGSAAKNLATKAGISAQDAATLQADLTDPVARQKALTVATKIQNAAAPSGATP